MKFKLILVSILTLMMSCQSSQTRQPNQDNTAPTDSRIEFDFIHTQQNCKVPIDEAKGI